MSITHYRLLVDNNSILPASIGLVQRIATSTDGTWASAMATWAATAVRTASIVCGSSGTFYHKMVLFLQNL